MSLLLNEDFTTYTLRHAYLTHIHDGVGERLINLNTSVLNNPAFRAAGWTADNAAIKRCYSPPIPTTGAGVSSAYFQLPGRATRQGVRLDDGDGEGDHEEGRGMVSGAIGSEDTIGQGGLAVNERKRRQRTRKEQLEEDDSSDLESDESEEDEKSAAHGIQFRKMPVRVRSKSSPVKPLQAELDKDGDGGIGIMVTSPSRPPEGIAQGLRRGSLGRVDAIKQRARRDTTTSSEMSSENELDPNAFTRKIPGRPPGRGEKRVHLAERIQEEEELQEREVDSEEGEGDDDLGGDSDLDDDVDEASDLSDEFDVDDATADSPSLLGAGAGIERASEDISPIKKPPDMPTGGHGQARISLTKRASEDSSLNKPLPKLPPGRPLSAIPPPSLLTAALKGPTSSSPGGKPFQQFADLYGKAEANPFWIKIYAPFSETPTDAIEVPINRIRGGQAQPQAVTVSDLIGLALWKYNEEEYEPPIDKEEETSINRWTLRIVEDEEIDYDFEALLRTRPLTDFTSNNNRPPQRRAREKPWDEFGLVRATDEQFKENEELTPQIGAASTPGISPSVPQTPRTEVSEQQSFRPGLAQRGESTASTAHIASHMSRSGTPTFKEPPRNPITGPSLAASALRKETGSTTALDAPQREHAQSTPRTGAPKTVTLSYTDPNSFATSNVKVDTTADTYIAEIFDYGCQKLNLDKALYILKVHGTQTVAPSDRTVEALGEKLWLDLARRRFIGAGIGAGDGMLFGLGLSGSPGSSSPNAPLELNPAMGTPGSGGGKKKGKTSAAGGIQKFDASNLTSATLHNLLGGPGGDFGGKKYSVLRKQPLSFAPSHPRTLVITPEYLQILPAAPDSLAAPSGKVTNVPMTSIIGVKVSRKHPKMVRVLVYREKETKRYDFEAQNREEAGLIMQDVRKGIDGVAGDGAGVF